MKSYAIVMEGLGLRWDLDIWATNADNSWLSQNRTEESSSGKGSPLEVRIYCQIVHGIFWRRAWAFWTVILEVSQKPYPDLRPLRVKYVPSIRQSRLICVENVNLQNGHLSMGKERSCHILHSYFVLYCYLESGSMKYNRLCLLIHIVWSRWTK